MPRKDYPQIALSQLKQLFRNPKYIKDPNAEINRYLKQSERGHWYPPYLFKCSANEYAMLKPFKSDNYTDKECNEDIRNASLLIQRLKKRSISATVLYITETADDIGRLARLSPPEEFGVIYVGDDRIFIDQPIRRAFYATCKLCPNILKYLSSCKNLQGEVGDLVRGFSKEYLLKKPNDKAENIMISKFRNDLLSSGQKHKISTKAIELIENIEKITGNSREHYFHSYNTMMLGFMILDKLYSTFRKIIHKKYGSDIDLEHLWVLTSIFHDIGYAVSKLDKVAFECLGLESEESEEVVSSCIKQARITKWENDCSVPVDMLNDVFRQFNKRLAAKWDYDGFPRPQKNSHFKNALKTSYIEKTSHGVDGAIKMIQLTLNQLKKTSKEKDRKFTIKHFAFASIAILLHDPKVRQCLRDVSIKNVKTIDFLFAALLVYADTLQNERRDLTGAISRPDLICDIIVQDNKIIAKLNKKSLTSIQKHNMMQELEEVFSFFIMNGIAFVSPAELT